MNTRVFVASLIEAARCLGVAQAKNDTGAMEHWQGEVERYEKLLTAQSENTATEALEYIFGKMPLIDWRKIIDERMTPPWPLEHHARAMGLFDKPPAEARSGDWVMVPREPTPEMGIAFGNAPGHSSAREELRLAWSAMLAAAPQPPAEAQRCTCPSGDGSLRWPCPAHPAEAQAHGGAGAITDADIAEWESERGNGMVSVVGEYTPDEFWLLLDEVKRLRTAPPSAPVGVEGFDEWFDEYTKNNYTDEMLALAAWKQALAQQPAADERPVGWWNGILPDVTDRSPYGPSIHWGADAENSGHDIPLYAGVNPSRVQQPAADKFVATFRCESNGIVGTTNAPIHSVSMHDDGVIEVVIDHWPEQPAAVDEAMVRKVLNFKPSWSGVTVREYLIEGGMKHWSPGSYLYDDEKSKPYRIVEQALTAALAAQQGGERHG